MNETEKTENAEDVSTESAVIPESAQVPPQAAAAPASQPQQAYQVPPHQTYAPHNGQHKIREQGFGSARKEKWPAVVLAAALGSLGIHKFYLGYKSEGLAMLLITLIGSLCFGIGPAVMVVFSIIEAVKYVSLTEEDFEATYVRNYKGWF